ncbi:MAG: hypothetical protein MUF64_06905 [Polyangiaceae bacterium]|jgi:hypothetical protein|nr:hypothetical protein [Polyangiaceae bacterium]
MTTTLGFLHSTDYDAHMGAGGTLRLMAFIARHMETQRVRVIAEGGTTYLEVRADGTVLPKVFGPEEDPHDDFEPTVQQLGYVGWPSDAAPSMMPHLILPCFDGGADLAALRNEPLLAEAGVFTVGNLDDAQIHVAEPVAAESAQAFRADAENLLQCAGALELVMIYR